MSQELAANRFLMEKLNSIVARLESIERMLCAESKPESYEFLSESAVPSPGMILIEDEPEWLPMIEAPLDMMIMVKSIKSKSTYVVVYNRLADLWQCKYNLNFKSSELEGWRPL